MLYVASMPIISIYTQLTCITFLLYLSCSSFPLNYLILSSPLLSITCPITPSRLGSSPASTLAPHRTIVHDPESLTTGYGTSPSPGASLSSLPSPPRSDFDVTYFLPNLLDLDFDIDVAFLQYLVSVGDASIGRDYPWFRRLDFQSLVSFEFKRLSKPSNFGSSIAQFALSTSTLANNNPNSPTSWVNRKFAPGAFLFLLRVASLHIVVPLFVASIPSGSCCVTCSQNLIGRKRICQTRIPTEARDRRHYSLRSTLSHSSSLTIFVLIQTVQALSRSTC